MWAMKTINGSRRLRSARIDAAQRAQIVSAFENSGLSAAAFVRLHGLNCTTFSGWRQRQRKVKSLPAFVQVEVAAPAAAVELVIELGAQARMRLHSESQLVLATWKSMALPARLRSGQRQ